MQYSTKSQPLSYFFDPALHTSRFKITIGQNNVDNKPDDQLFIMQDTIEPSRQYSDEKTKNIIEYLTEMIISMMDQINF